MSAKQLKALIETWRDRAARNDMTASKAVFADLKYGATCWAECRRECAQELEAALALCESPAAETPERQPPFVHHRCKPSNLPDSPPFGMWCTLDRTWPADAAAQQFDYTCTHCGERISVNVEAWKSRDRGRPLPAPPTSGAAHETKT